MIKYPNGANFNQEVKEKKKHSVKDKAELSLSAANRGMDFEHDINLSNEYYRDKGICLITKRPTPINVVKVDYSKGALITNAYFEEQSTTDYNGVYKGKYIDFEAKNTQSKTSFPLANITKHQIEHLKLVLKHGGIAFFVINFQKYDEAYLLDANYVIHFFEKEERKSIPYSLIKEKGILIKKGYNPRLYYIDAVEEMYFKN